MKRLLDRISQKLGVCVFRRNTLERTVVYYNRWGVAPHPFLSHFVKIDKVKICIDAGANRGQTAEYFSAIFPQTAIYSFEPVAATFAKLLEATANLPRVVAIHSALGGTVGELQMEIGADDQRNSIIRDQEISTVSDRESVPVTTVDALMKKEGFERVHMLKSDTEGYDLNILRGAEQALQEERVDFIYCEFDFERGDNEHTYFPDILEYVSARGFYLCGFYHAAHFNQPARWGYANALFGHRNTLLTRPWQD